MIMENKEVLLPQLKERYVRDKFQELHTEQNDGAVPTVKVDRKKSLAFMKLGKKNNKDFITDSCLGMFY